VQLYTWAWLDVNARVACAFIRLFALLGEPDTYHWEGEVSRGREEAVAGHMTSLFYLAIPASLKHAQPVSFMGLEGALDIPVSSLSVMEQRYSCWLRAVCVPRLCQHTTRTPTTTQCCTAYPALLPMLCCIVPALAAARALPAALPWCTAAPAHAALSLLRATNLFLPLFCCVLRCALRGNGWTCTARAVSRGCGHLPSCPACLLCYYHYSLCHIPTRSNGFIAPL